MKKIIITIIIIFPLFWLIGKSLAASENLTGKILLQTEENGEAWYVNPGDQKRYFLSRPQNAFEIMRNLGIGISDENLKKIAIGIIKDSKDSDSDGLSDSLEKTIGTNPQKKDSDQDGYDDKTEITNNYNPLGANKIKIDQDFSNINSGKIFLQVEKNGEAWYINPADQKRYYLNKPENAFEIMHRLSLGASNEDLAKISIGQIAQKDLLPNSVPTCSSCEINRKSAIQVFAAAAEAIRQGRANEAASYFAKNIEKAIKYTVNFLNSEDRLMLGNILSGATLSATSDDKITYSTEVYFSLGERKVPLNFYLEKQGDGNWLLTNL